MFKVLVKAYTVHSKTFGTEDLNANPAVADARPPSISGGDGVSSKNPSPSFGHAAGVSGAASASSVSVSSGSSVGSTGSAGAGPSAGVTAAAVLSTASSAAVAPHASTSAPVTTATSGLADAGPVSTSSSTASMSLPAPLPAAAPSTLTLLETTSLPTAARTGPASQPGTPMLPKFSSQSATAGSDGGGVVHPTAVVEAERAGSSAPDAVPPASQSGVLSPPALGSGDSGSSNSSSATGSNSSSSSSSSSSVPGGRASGEGRRGSEGTPSAFVGATAAAVVTTPDMVPRSIAAMGNSSSRLSIGGASSSSTNSSSSSIAVATSASGGDVTADVVTGSDTAAQAAAPVSRSVSDASPVYPPAIAIAAQAAVVMPVTLGSPPVGQLSHGVGGAASPGAPLADVTEAPVAELYCNPRVKAVSSVKEVVATPPKPAKPPAGAKLRPVSQALSDVVYIQVSAVRVV